MRRVHDGLGEIGGESLSGRVRIAVSGPARLLFVPSLLEGLTASHPNLEPSFVDVHAGDESASLLRGEIDVALTHAAHEHENTEVERLGQLRTAVFCAPAHELHAKPSPTRAQILDAAFAVVGGGNGREAGDAWPVGVRRRVGVRVASLEMALTLCLGGEYLAALPELVGERHPELRRLSLGGLSAVPIFSLRREQLSAPAKAEACIRVMRRVLARLT
jgi:DNA-binding transcriptional LysR family regulator